MANQMHVAGQTRIRSNVCFDQAATHLVPGDLAMTTGHKYDMTTKQKAEAMYYSKCCICRRSSFEINRDGCRNPACK
jgi:hypothetical protein